MPGSETVNRNLDAWLAQVREKLLKLAQETGQAMAYEARASAPWEDETGAARDSIVGTGWEEGNAIKAGVGIQDKKGPWLELGTGPRGVGAEGMSGPMAVSEHSPEFPIYPKRARFLRWMDKEGEVHYSTSVMFRGMRPRRVLKPVRDRKVAEFVEGARKILQGGGGP